MVRNRGGRRKVHEDGDKGHLGQPRTEHPLSQLFGVSVSFLSVPAVRFMKNSMAIDIVSTGDSECSQCHPVDVLHREWQSRFVPAALQWTAPVGDKSTQPSGKDGTSVDRREAIPHSPRSDGKGKRDDVRSVVAPFASKHLQRDGCKCAHVSCALAAPELYEHAIFIFWHECVFLFLMAFEALQKAGKQRRAVVGDSHGHALAREAGMPVRKVKQLRGGSRDVRQGDVGDKVDDQLHRMAVSTVDKSDAHREHKPCICLIHPEWYCAPYRVMASLWHFHVIAGSTSSRGLRVALEDLTKRLRDGEGWSFLCPDGPSGPLYFPRLGAVKLAAMTGTPFVPLRFSVLVRESDQEKELRCIQGSEGLVADALSKRVQASLKPTYMRRLSGAGGGNSFVRMVGGWDRKVLPFVRSRVGVRAGTAYFVRPLSSRRQEHIQVGTDGYVCAQWDRQPGEDEVIVQRLGGRARPTGQMCGLTVGPFVHRELPVGSVVLPYHAAVGVFMEEMAQMRTLSLEAHRS